MSCLALFLVVCICTNVEGFQTSFKVNIKFKDVSFWKGLNHIHSLEHVTTTHTLGVPLFRIKDTLPPYMENGSVCLNSTCSVLNLKPMKVLFKSKHINTNEMSFLHSETSERFLKIDLKVLPCIGDPNSHFFQIQLWPQFYVPMWLGQIYMWIVVFISANEDRLFYFSGKKKFEGRAHCQKYRQMVFSKKNKKIKKNSL